jgi:hypothetical protein
MSSRILPQRKFLKTADSLLKTNFSELSSYHLETQKYWTLAVDAALKAKALESARGARAKQVQRKLNTKIPSRKKLGIVIVEQQIHEDGMHRAAAQPDALQPSDGSQVSLDRFVQKKPHPASIMGNMKSNKRTWKPD